MLKMDLEYERGIFFVRLKGTLNKKTSYKINNYIVPILKKHQIKYLVYNLSNLKNIDESGVNAILNTKCTIRINRGKIYLCEVNDNLNLKIKSLHIKITSSEMTALKLIEV